MAKSDPLTTVFREARKSAIKEAYIPKSLRGRIEITKEGRIVIVKKAAKQKIETQQL